MRLCCKRGWCTLLRVGATRTVSSRRGARLSASRSASPSSASLAPVPGLFSGQVVQASGPAGGPLQEQTQSGALKGASPRVLDSELHPKLGLLRPTITEPHTVTATERASLGANLGIMSR